MGGDALRPPARPHTLAASNDPRPSLYQPSAFMAGRVAVQAIFVESDGSQEPSKVNWTSEQVAAVREQIAIALEWWRARLPDARLSFDLTTRIAPSGYEPANHSLNTEGQWIGDTFTRMGVAGTNYFEQAYAAADSLRRARGTDWATTIFVVNSTGTPDGAFADGHFAYAYISGPFLVLTSDAGPYGTQQIAPVIAHELGHTFGALDQYAAAGTPCTQQSGYLAVASTNSQSNNCGTHFASIMLDPLAAYADGLVDGSALGQIGYRDTDGDGRPDPIDTTPQADLQIAQSPAGGRPSVTGRVLDQPYPSPLDVPASINTITRAEYRVDGGSWIALPPQDGAYDATSEALNTTLPLYDGRHTIEAHAVNSVGALSSPVRTTVDIAGVGPAPAYQVSAPALSDSQDITIELGAPAGSSVQISAEPFFAGAAWRAVTPTMNWHLGAKDGTYQLYVRFRDANRIESPAFTRPILLDQTPPDGNVTRYDRPSPRLDIHAEDGGSGVAAMQLIPTSGAAGMWQPFQSTLPFDPGLGDIHVRLRDAAGNVSQPLSIHKGGSIYLPLVLR
jgi:hypothetical protein